MNCVACGDAYSVNFPEVILRECGCIVCIYCAIGSICMNYCVICRGRNCVFFEFVGQQLTNERIFAMKEAFLNDYQRLSANINLPPLNLPHLHN